MDFIFKENAESQVPNRNFTALISSLLVSELPDGLLLNPVHRYSVGFLIRKHDKKTGKKTLSEQYYTSHDRFRNLFSLEGESV